MSKPVRLDQEAEEELEAAHEWYESQRVGLGGEFLDSVQEVLLRIEDSTDLGA